jgi:hypothetical protein
MYLTLLQSHHLTSFIPCFALSTRAFQISFFSKTQYLANTFDTLLLKTKDNLQVHFGKFATRSKRLFPYLYVVRYSYFENSYSNHVHLRASIRIKEMPTSTMWQCLHLAERFCWGAWGQETWCVTPTFRKKALSFPYLPPNKFYGDLYL